MSRKHIQESIDVLADAMPGCGQLLAASGSQVFLEGAAEYITNLRAELREAVELLRRAKESLKGARCPAVLDNARTAEWSAWYDERDAVLTAAIEADRRSR